MLLHAQTCHNAANCVKDMPHTAEGRVQSVAIQVILTEQTMVYSNILLLSYSRTTSKTAGV